MDEGEESRSKFIITDGNATELLAQSVALTDFCSQQLFYIALSHF